MSRQIAPQHPAVVLRSHYVQLRALLAVAMIAVVGLAAAVVVLAIDNAGGNSAAPARIAAPAASDARYDGGPEEGTRGPFGATANPYLYNGGHDEGRAGPTGPSR